MQRILGIVNHAIHLPIRGKNGAGMLQARKKTRHKPFCTCLAPERFASVRPKLQLMRFRLLFCAVLAILCAQLHAQSTGLFVNSSNNVGIGTTNPATSGGGGSPKTLEIEGPSGQTVPWGQLVLSSPNAGGPNYPLGGIEFASRAIAPYPRGGYIYCFKEDNSTTAADANLQFGVANAGISGGVAYTAMTIRSNGNVGIGTATPSTNLDVSANATENGLMTGQFHLTGSTNPNQRLVLGYDTTNDFGFIETGIAGTAVKNLILAPRGGNVGIGTTNPAGKLTISGAGGSVASDGAEWYSIGNADGYNGWAGRIYAGTPTGGWGTAPFIFAVPDGSGNQINALTLLNGNVGIGTTNPAAGLSVVSGNGGANGNWFDPANYAGHIHNGVNSPQHYGLLVSDYWRSPENFIFAVDGRWANDGTIQNDSHTPYFIINGTGNVGIGTASPQYLLDVNGVIHANEIITPNYDWADYVFDKNYKLASLSEVERTIKQEKHLPGMPSAAEVAAHGLSMGEMQSKLLQKIEELTLHQIEQEKRLNEQSEDIEQLRKENAELREKLTK